ncbi:MAG TPA: prolyl oligopeptidase family serine peptidase [Flavitalea sp.]|nr:prolyl oligopeptidase family serine peptidase [Flavitalea sp.]
MIKWFCFLVSTISFSYFSYAQLQYPVTRKVDQSDNYHGTMVSDPYRWLENDTSVETKKWVTEQNELTFRYLGSIAFRDSIKNRLATVYNYERYSIPVLNNGFYYFFKNDGLQNQSVLYRQKGINGKVEMLLDPNTLSSDATTQLIDFEVSKNGKYAAYSLSKAGSDWRTIFIKDLTTMKDLRDSINWVKSSQTEWQKNGFYYSRYPAPAKGKELSSANENHQVWYHQIGTNQENDKLIYKDSINLQRFNIAMTSEDERYVFLYSDDRGKGFRGNSLFYLDNQSRDKIYKPIVAEIGNFQYLLIGVIKNKFLIFSNADAQNNKILQFDPDANPGKEWTTIIPEKKENLQSASLAGGKLFLRYLVDVTSHVYVYTVNGKMEKEIILPGPGNAAGFNGRNTDKFTFYSFNTFNVPTRIYRYDIASGKSKLYRKPLIAFDTDYFETKQEFYTSRDGTRVPLFIVHKKGMALSGDNPAMLYGYGGFNVSMNPFFSASLIPWLEQGGIFAVANLRGGSEYGEKWHEAGMFDKKQNVFDDFISAAEYLINKKYTSPLKLAIRGGSNGGLLVGAVMNQRPDLFKVAIPEVGVMDMLRFQKFTIGWNWKAEYGSSDTASNFKYLYAYSPLHNIKADKNYPATLVITSDHDDRVVPAHSFKYSATLQELYKGKNPVLIRIDTNSGHGMSNMMKNIELTADIYAFTLYNMGLQWKN